LLSEDANVHLQYFLEPCDTIVIKDVAPDIIRLRLFPFSLMGKVKQWFYKDKEAVSTWNKCSTTFLAKFFSTGKTNALHGRISNFQQTASESIPETWERLQEYILACPHHGMKDWLILQNFYNGLTSTSRAHIDAAAGGAFFSLTVNGAMTLIEKMVSNQRWSEDKLQTKEDDMHTVEGTDMLAAKLDLLIKHLDKHGTVQSLYSHIPCEMCGNFGHSRNDFLETHVEAWYNNYNGFCPQGHPGWNQSHPQN